MAKLTKEQRAEQEHLYGCTVELDAGEVPDDCGLDYGAPGDCQYALSRKTKWSCPYWVLRSDYASGLRALSEHKGE